MHYNIESFKSNGLTMGIMKKENLIVVTSSIVNYNFELCVLGSKECKTMAKFQPCNLFIVFRSL